MEHAAQQVTRLGMAHFRYGDFPFGLRQSDRLLHMYIVGQTGTGKSTLLHNLASQDARHGVGFCLIDPHGDLAEALADQLGPDTVYWDLADPSSRLGYNPLKRTSPEWRPLVASGLIDTLKKQWSEAWGVRMEHLLRHAILALLERPRTDLREVLRLFLDRAFRAEVLEAVTDPQVRQFWQTEYPAMNYKNAADGLAPIANKLGAFLAHPTVRAALCAPREPLRFRRIMDDGQTLIVNLGKGRLGSETANVVGGLLVCALSQAAFTRQAQAAGHRRPFMLYVDEFHAFTTDAFADVLSELRKYGVGLVLSQQHTVQISASVLASILGNVGTILCFRVGARDAALLSHQMGGPSERDILNQPNHRAFVRMIQNGAPLKAFTMSTWPAKGTQLPSPR